MCGRVIKVEGMRFVTTVAAATVLAACAGEDGADYCKNHHLFHPDHLESIASLTIEVSDSGDLDGRLTVPRVVIGSLPESAVEQLLSDPERTFVLQADTPCELSLSRFSATAGGYDANYSASCGPGNQLGKINVALFDQLPDLDEVVVSVTTAATAKHFGISRQCDKPIFRLMKK
jgi:hypothetical protein